MELREERVQVWNCVGKYQIIREMVEKNYVPPFFSLLLSFRTISIYTFWIRDFEYGIKRRLIKNHISFYVKATISGIDYTWINWTIIMWNFVTKKVETLLCQNFSTFHSEEHNLKEKVKIFRNLTHLSLLHSHIFKNKILITKFAMYLSVLYPTATVFVSRNSHFPAS